MTSITGFVIRFFICNLYLCVIVGVFLGLRQLFYRTLTARIQYHLWYLLLGLLSVPFLPFPSGFLQTVFRFSDVSPISMADAEASVTQSSLLTSSVSADWMRDFGISVNRETPSVVGLLLCMIWFAGISVMILWTLKSASRLRQIQRSSLPLQNIHARRIYENCLREMKITRDIPIRSTVFLKTPVMTGLWNPCIYLPVHLISDSRFSQTKATAISLRYILLHELQHYRYKDALANYIMNLIRILYWFNPAIWYALREMRSDREAACDASVLKMLKPEEYEAYGHTLISFAEKLSLASFSFTMGISGAMKQVKRRILNIACYEKPSIRKRMKGFAVFGIAIVLLLNLAPAFSTYALEEQTYAWNPEEPVSQMDYSAYFDGYDGSFVLYDAQNASWTIYNQDQAVARISPDSTYKIYDALFGMDAGVITPEESRIAWSGKEYSFETWNRDQNLYSAMRASVNWYFQTIDEKLGASEVQNYLKKIHYGNEALDENLSTYWLESSLKISPVEQVELLRELYDNDFGFAEKHIQTVKDSLLLTASPDGTLYGKTGTGNINGQDVNGWFVGYVENETSTWFFAVNIQAEAKASGSKASEIALKILEESDIYKGL